MIIDNNRWYYLLSSQIIDFLRISRISCLFLGKVHLSLENYVWRHGNRNKLGLYIQLHDVVSFAFPPYCFTRCRRNAFNTTDTELRAIAAPANHGAKNPKAAIGIPNTLYANAQKRFCLMFRIVFLLIKMASAMLFK